MNTFLESYIETALWAETDGDQPLDANYSASDLAPATLAAFTTDCAAFEFAHADDLENAPTMRRAGHDFWLTRNGHGAGFWDGDWPEAVGERLTAAAHAVGPCELYVGDDGLIYACGRELPESP